MKQRMRRISALLLVVLMCVSMMVPAFAAEEGVICPGEGKIHTKSNCSYGEPVEKHEAGCGQQGYAVYQCEGCDAYFAADFADSFGGHDYQLVYKEATCLEAGYSKRVCSNCGDVESSEVLAALGHDPNVEDCDNPVCDRCGVPCEAKNNDHNWGAPVIDKAPTHKVVNGTPTLVPGEATLTCKDCGLTKKVPVECDLEHDWVSTPAVPATHTETGVAGGKTCTICGVTEKLSADQAEEPFATLPKTPCVPKADWVVTVPTCTVDGSAYQVCDLCGNQVGDTLVLGKLGHDYQTKVYAADANGKTFKQIAEEYKLATGLDSLTINVSGANVTISAANTETATYAWTGNFVDTPTEASYGANCGEYSYLQYHCFACPTTSTVIVEPGHDWKLVDSLAPDCINPGYNTYICQNHYCTGKVAGVDGDEISDFDNSGDIVAKKHVVIDENGHTYKPVVTVPDCFNTGYTLDVCTVCDAVDGERYDITEIDTSIHVPVDVVTTPATCTTPGLKNTVCARCETVLAENIVIPAQQHKIDRSNIIREADATCTAPGFKVYACSACAEEVVDYYRNALGHNFDGGHKATPANCALSGDLRNGYTNVFCKNCSMPRDPQPSHTVVFDPTNKAHHTVIVESSRVEGDCYTADVVTYTCLACKDIDGNSFSFTVVDNSVNGKGHTTKRVDEVKATCVTEGTRAHKACSCGFLTLDGQNEVTAADLVIPKLSETGAHAELVVIPGVPATCETAGNTAGEKCLKCNITTVATTTIPAVTHNYQLISAEIYEYNTRTANCTEWGYEFHQCLNCQDDIIKKYKGDLGGHVEEAYDAVAPSCSAAGSEAGIRCTRCEQNVSGGAVVPAVPHTNSDDKTFTTFVGHDGVSYAACDEALTNLTCKFCTVTFEKNHEWVITLVPAKCQQFSYELWVCANCELVEMKNEGFNFVDEHTWGDWVVVEEASVAADGLKSRTCSVCDAVEEVLIPALGGLDIEIDAENAVLEGAELTNSGLIAVTVSTKTKALDAVALSITLNYNSALLTPEGDCKVLNTNAGLVRVAFDDVNGLATIVAFASSSTDGSIKLAGEEALVTLYFRLASDVALDTEVEFSTAFVEVATVDGSAVNLDTTDTATAKVEALIGYINDDDVISLADLQIMMQYIAGETDEDYCAAADINLDGKISSADFGLLQQYLLGEITEEELAEAYKA